MRLRARERRDVPGAIVVGGDYQGLGIIRSLGRHGIPTCVVDDERSIGKFSRYATHSLHVPDLRDEETAVETALAAAARFGLEGWVLFPTRDEHVATFSRHRDRLSKQFRVPTPRWEVTRWACDKRNTYRLARSLGIPTPRMWQVRSAAELDQIDAAGPLVIKPAIKEHFIYATGDISINSEKLCAVINNAGTDCDWNTWDPNKKMLIFASNGTTGVTVGPSQTEFQGGLYATNTVSTGQSAVTEGPLVSGTKTVVLGQQFGGTFPPVTIAPWSISQPPGGFWIDPPTNFHYGS